MQRGSRRHDGMVLLGSLVALGAATALLRLVPRVSPTSVALVFLLVVLGAATLGRLRVAIGVSLAAMLTLNFFFLPPLHTFVVEDPQNWVALVVFVAVSVTASKLSTAARTQARDAIASRQQVVQLFELTRDVLRTTDPDLAGAGDRLAGHIADRFALPGLALCLRDARGWTRHQGTEVPVSPPDTWLDAVFAGGPADAPANAPAGTPADGWRAVPVRQGTRPIGLLVVAMPADTPESEAPEPDRATLDAVAGVVAIALDRAAFLAERKAADLARQRADLAGAVLASLSHDLRTPLTAIGVAVENLGGELPWADRRTQAEAGRTELRRLTRLVQDLLDMARVDAGAVPVDREWVTPADVVDAAIAYVQPQLEGHPLRVEAGGDTEVRLDPRLCSMALSHLLENAARYSPSGAPIRIAAVVDSEGLSLAVTDAGAGLAPGEEEQIFERFHRGRAASASASAGREGAGRTGTGMGLAITRGLLRAAGGTVMAANASGGGACFTVRVPGETRAVALVS